MAYPTDSLGAGVWENPLLPVTAQGQSILSQEPRGRLAAGAAGGPSWWRMQSEVVVARLKALPGRLAGLPPRVAAMPKVAEGFYTSAEWRDYRRGHGEWTVRQQGGVWCCQCGSGGRLILDHRVERRDGGADFPPFEEADWFCTPCHNRKTAEAKAARARGGR